MNYIYYRIYHALNDDEPRFGALCHLTCTDPDVDLCNSRKNPSFGDLSLVFPMIWRFLPILDSQVSHFMSRDLDSVVTQREVDAVEEWLKSNKSFHVMRDHPNHEVIIFFLKSVFVIPGSGH